MRPTKVTYKGNHRKEKINAVGEIIISHLLP